jgi:arabinogalactan endo-1,4-beta-galactosidase
MVAEYAEVHEQVNDIVFNLPDEKGIGTFVWEPTRWNETLFTNGGQTTELTFILTCGPDTVMIRYL